MQAAPDEDGAQGDGRVNAERTGQLESLTLTDTRTGSTRTVPAAAARSNASPPQSAKAPLPLLNSASTCKRKREILNRKVIIMHNAA